MLIVLVLYFVGDDEHGDGSASLPAAVLILVQY